MPGHEGAGCAGQRDRAEGLTTRTTISPAAAIDDDEYFVSDGGLPTASAAGYTLKGESDDD
ncbi:MAG: hypothetical protein ACLUJG_07105 [Lawsonibacter sp.]